MKRYVFVDVDGCITPGKGKAMNFAAIGDSDGDLGVFRMVGRAFAPANASEAVRATCRYVSEHAHTLGVIDIFRRFLTTPLRR